MCARREFLKCLSPLPSYFKFCKFKYFKTILRRNKTYSAFRHLFIGRRNRQFIASFPPYWIQKGAINRLGTNKLVMSTRFLTVTCEICLVDVVGGCFAFPDVQKGLILHATPFLDDERRKQGNFERSGLISWTKESEVGTYTKFLDMFEILYSRRLYLSLQLRWWSNKQAIPAKAYTCWNRNNCCAISPCRGGDKSNSGHWKCKESSWTGG